MEMEEKMRRERGRLSFAGTCSLLSQFLKENRSCGEQKGMDMVYQQQEKEKESYQPPVTMNLFPLSNIAAEVSKKGKQKEREMNASLTIFYRGKMMVFDNFPAMKAENLMEMASKNVNSNAAGATTASPLPPEAQASVDLSMPIARRASLHRFLEKRKDRIKNNAPYLFKGLRKMEPTMSEMKPEKKQSWLALGHN